MEQAPVLSVHQLEKMYGDTHAVRGVSFTVKQGEIVGLLGPNGAGKTTTISMILGIVEPTSGHVTVLGRDINRDNEAKSLINFAAVYAQLPGNLTVYQNLKVFGLLYGVKSLQKRIDQLLTEFDLTHFRNVKVGVLSSGEQTRVALAKALLNEPRLLLLDEPTASLDPHIAQGIRARVKVAAQQHQTAVLWTSHNMHEVEMVCDRVILFSHGTILLQGNPKTLPAQYQKKNLEELFISAAQEPLSLTEIND